MFQRCVKFDKMQNILLFQGIKPFHLYYLFHVVQLSLETESVCEREREINMTTRKNSFL